MPIPKHIFKIVKFRFAARRVHIVSLPSVTPSETKSARRGRAYRSREDLYSDTDFIFSLFAISS